MVRAHEHARSWGCRWLSLALALLTSFLGTGCAALTNPVAEGIPARRVPPEFLARCKNGLKSIPLNLLGQPKPKEYRLAPGDTLGVLLDGVLGAMTLPLPILATPLNQDPNQLRFHPSSGYPVPVEDDGTVNLPRIGSVQVCGMTIAEARQAIFDAAVEKKVLKPAEGIDRLLVQLLQPRLCPVLVFRQEASSFAQGQFGFLPASKRGTGHTVLLPGYENDVLHALLRTGGLPGFDACNEVLIHRNAKAPSLHSPFGERIGEVVRIPLRLLPGAPLPIKPNDVLLGPGDVVYLEADEDEVFFTGGLIPPGRYPLPRDRDMTVLDAISFARGPIINGSFAVSNLSGFLIQPGIGSPNPTRVTVIRRTANCGQVPIIVDLAEAMRDPTENILIKGGDFIVLQETPGQAMTRYFTQTFFNFNLVWQAIHDKFITGIVNVAAPDRIANQVPTINITPPQ